MIFVRLAHSPCKTLQTKHLLSKNLFLCFRISLLFFTGFLDKVLHHFGLDFDTLFATLWSAFSTLFLTFDVRCSKAAVPPPQGTQKKGNGRHLRRFGFRLPPIWLQFGFLSHPFGSLLVPLGANFPPLAYPVGHHQRRHTRGGGSAGLLRRR